MEKFIIQVYNKWYSLQRETLLVQFFNWNFCRMDAKTASRVMKKLVW